MDESVARYLAELDRADRDPALLPEGRVPQLQQKLATLREQMQQFDAIEQQLEDVPDHQISLTDPDARSMTSHGRGTGTVGYNLQVAVDAEHHLIVAHEVINVGNDRAQLSTMAKKARDALGAEQMTALADRGYFSSLEILACEQGNCLQHEADDQDLWFARLDARACRLTVANFSVPDGISRTRNRRQPPESVR